MTKEELEKLRLQMPSLATDMLFREKPTCVKDEHGFYSTGCFLWKGNLCSCRTKSMRCRRHLGIMN